MYGKIRGSFFLNSALFGVGNGMTLVKLGPHLVFLKPTFSMQRQLRCQALWRFPGTPCVTRWSLRAVFLPPFCKRWNFGWSTKVWMNHRAWLLTFHPPFWLQKILKKSWALAFAASFFQCVFFHVRNLGLRAFGRALQSHGALFYAFSWRAIQGKGFNFHWAWVYPV